MDLSVPAHRSKTSKQAICAAVAELGDVSGAPATSVLSFVGSRIIPGDFYVHSSVMSDRFLCCTAHPFFLISESSVKPSNLTDGEGDLEGSL